MKKLTSIILAALLSATALCACSQGTQSVPDITETQEETEAELTTVEETTEAEPTTETVTEAAPLTEEELAPADILTYTVEVNGKTLSIPFDYDELVELGFSLKEDDELKAQSYTIGVYPENADGKFINVQFLNSTDEPKKYSQCQIGMIEFRVEHGLNVVLPGGLPFDGRASADDIIKKYGEPKNTIEGKGYKILEYGVGFSKVEFNIHDDANLKYTDTVKIQNLNN